MTKAVRSRILKDANGDIGDHLRNHIHLTNCIHLKNHMHKQSPILADRSLMRELIALQRSRSLKDPSASPPSWNSPSVVDILLKKGSNDAKVREGRKSVGAERQREGSRRRSGSSPSSGSLAPAKVVPDDFLGADSVRTATSDRSSKSVARDVRRVKKDESVRKSNLIDILEGGENQLRDVDLVLEVASYNPPSEERDSKQKEKHGQDAQVKTLSEQLNDFYADSDKASSSNRLRGWNPHQERTAAEAQVSVRGHGSANRGKRRKFRSARRTRTTPISRDVGGQNEISVASNSLGHGSVQRRSNMVAEQEEEVYGNQNVSRAPRNGCGIPFNWSRIHDRGKTFLDMAGRSLSCGLSDSRSRKQCTGSHDRDVLVMAVASDHSSSSSRSDGEALPLLVEAYGSQGSTENAAWEHDYSGELGIYADHLLKNDVDSNLASEGRSGNQRMLGRAQRNRHQNLTQKYMPRTFRDLVGQNLVVQALSNAVMRRKVGLLYVFYGHHGTGKTSCARVFARALNCQSLEHPKPCGYCNSCIAHEKGKSRSIKEVGPVSNFDFENMMDLLDNMIISQLSSQYKVFIFDDCDSLSLDCWSAISKVIDRAPRRVVFILVCSSLEVLPHIIIARCQKFFLPKLKDADVISTLQWISSRENIDIDKEALKLVASRSDGSLRDAEMTLEQLSLLGQKITVALVQELVGLISDEKLVDLLDLALSADTVNTVKNLRAIMESGVEPFALMSQLATIITDILAGSYDFTKERNRRKFFRKQPLSKEDMEKLRQALKTLSEAEKQLRLSNDKLTWLTAALLQLAPDQQYLIPGSSAEGSFNHSPLPANDLEGRDVRRRAGESSVVPDNDRGGASQSRLENRTAGVSREYNDSGMPNGVSTDRRRTAAAGMNPQRLGASSSSIVKVDGRHIPSRIQREYEEIWLEVLQKMQHSSIRDFLYQEGKLIYISYGAAPTVQLVFSSHVNRSKAEKLGALILQAFESVLGSPVTIEMRSEPSRESRAGYHTPLVLPTARAGPNAQTAPETNAGGRIPRTGESRYIGRTEIVEMPISLQELKGEEQAISIADAQRIQQPRLSAASQEQSTVGSILERRNPGELSHSKSLVRGKVSLAHVIQQAEAQQAGWSKRKAVSIAEKLEQENLRLESRSRNLLCWKAPKVTRRRLSRLKIRTRRPHSLLKLVSCGKCLSSRSPR